MDYYTQICVKYLLDCKNIDVRGMYNELRNFEKVIENSIRNKEKKFLPNASAKEEAAYKNPWSTLSVKAVYAWNITNPDRQVSVPCKVNVVKLKVFKQEDLEPIKYDYPEIYDKIITHIYNNPNKDISRNGFKVIAIPNQVAEIPDWLIPIIDYDSMVADILGKFKCVLDLVNMGQLNIGKTTTRKNKKFTNIVKF